MSSQTSYDEFADEMPKFLHALRITLAQMELSGSIWLPKITLSKTPCEDLLHLDIWLERNKP